MTGPGVHTGEATERSMISVVSVAGLLPPKFITFGMYAGGRSGRMTLVP